ncbi:glycosyltransferase family 1 protein [Rhodoplanes elegans]|uniref:glycosyltransferase family 1 protein n=1 Tax=Rhodoplanes elegans TaxID=29408 RepID=UPI0011B936E6|nr:glycosyltransferase family 1 protein [Rhodoplanes elegans]
MPFALDESTRFISPAKTPEFLVAGLPVVSTPITDVIWPYGELGLVDIAATAEERAAAVEATLVPPSVAWLAAVDAQLDKGSWDATWPRSTKLRSVVSYLSAFTE